MDRLLIIIHMVLAVLWGSLLFYILNRPFRHKILDVEWLFIFFSLSAMLDNLYSFLSQASRVGLLSPRYYSLLSNCPFQLLSKLLFLLTCLYLFRLYASGRMKEIFRAIETFEYHNNLPNILEDFPYGTIAVDQGERVVYMNKAARQMTGERHQAFLGKQIPEDFNMGSRSITDLVRNILNGNLGYHEFTDEVSISGFNKELHFCIYPVHNKKSHIVGAVIFVKDITLEQKLLRQAQVTEQFSIMSRLAAATTHEIRNPLTTVRGFIQLLAQKATIPEKEEYFSIILSELDRVEAIISEFLSLSRPKVPQMVQYNMQRLLDEVCLLYEGECINHSIALRRHYINSLPDSVMDPAQLKQVFLNLFANAVEAMKNGGELLVEAWYDRSREIISVTVCDQGSGILPENLKKLGTVFFTTKPTGTGLGLSICYRIVKEHGGILSFESEPGKGTRVHVDLPLDPKKPLANLQMIGVK